MARASNSRRHLAALLACPIALAAGVAAACPFCKPLERTLTQWRDSAAVAALAEVSGPTVDGATPLDLVRVFRPPDGTAVAAAGPLTVPLDRSVRVGDVLLVFGTGPRDATPRQLAWHAVPVDELGYGYFDHAPGGRVPAAERLKYFARYLEHPNAMVAEDAYQEFAHAPFADVAAMAAALPDGLAAWLVDPGVPAHRKGFYGMALGLAGDTSTRRANAVLLRSLIVAPEDDFRAGFDGILGGWLLLTGEPGLELIESRYLANAEAADGDVRHALAAIRFYQEYGRQIDKRRLGAAVRCLLARHQFAEMAIVDLARWQHWDALDQVAALYEPASETPALRRAVVGYLLACPGPQARAALTRLRAIDPQGVAAAEAVLSRTGSLPQSE